MKSHARTQRCPRTAGRPASECAARPAPLRLTVENVQSDTRVPSDDRTLAHDQIAEQPLPPAASNIPPPKLQLAYSSRPPMYIPARDRAEPLPRGRALQTQFPPSHAELRTSRPPEASSATAFFIFLASLRPEDLQYSCHR